MGKWVRKKEIEKFSLSRATFACIGFRAYKKTDLLLGSRQ